MLGIVPPHSVGEKETGSNRIECMLDIAFRLMSVTFAVKDLLYPSIDLSTGGLPDCQAGRHPIKQARTKVRMIQQEANWNR